MPMATTTRMSARDTNGSSATSLSAMTMISAERMKSVRIAPLVIVFSCSASPAATGSSCSSWPGDLLPDLLGALVAEVGAADHEDRGQQPRQELAEQQGRREDDEQLVAQRADGDPLDDRQLAVGGEALHVARRDGGVVDDDARRLGAGRPAAAATSSTEAAPAWRAPRRRRAGRPVHRPGCLLGIGRASPRGREPAPTWPTVTPMGSPRLRADTPAPPDSGRRAAPRISRPRPSPPPGDGAPRPTPQSPGSSAARPSSDGRGPRPRLRQRRWLRPGSPRVATSPGSASTSPRRGPGRSRCDRWSRPLEAADATTWRTALRRRRRGRCRPRLRRSGRHPGCRAPSPRARRRVLSATASGTPRRPAAACALDATAEDFHDLAGLVALALKHGYEPVHGHVSTLEEWDEYEWSWTGSLTDWALDRGRDPGDREEALAAAAEHRDAWLGATGESWLRLARARRPRRGRSAELVRRRVEEGARSAGLVARSIARS